MRRVYPQNTNAIPKARCAQCLMVLTAQNEVEPPPIKPSVDEAIRYRLAQGHPTVHAGANDATGMGQAQRDDPTCHEVLTWFGDDLSPARSPTLRLEGAVGGLKWFNSRFDRLRLVHYREGTILLAILAETRQGEEAIKTKQMKTSKKLRLLCQFLREQQYYRWPIQRHIRV